MRPALVLLLLSGPALADGPAPRCDAARDGALACMAGRACLCRYDRGGTVTGRPAGHRWDCDAFRPDCAPPAPEGGRDAGAASPLPWADPPPGR